MLSNQIFRGPGWPHPHAAGLREGLMLSREDAGGEHPLFLFPEVLAAHRVPREPGMGEQGRRGGPGCGRLVWLWVPEVQLGSSRVRSSRGSRGQCCTVTQSRG